jgi:hypothetical protein
MAANAPANVPDKFKDEAGNVNVEALAKSYLALEQRLSGKPEEAEEQGTEESLANLAGDPKPKEEAPPASLAEALAGDPAPSNTDASALWAKMKDELTVQGSVTDETRKALAAANIPAEAIEAVKAGVVAKQAADLAKAKEIAGGEENLKVLFDHLKKTRTADQRQALIRQIQSEGGDLYLRGLVAEAAQAGAFGEKGSLISTAAQGVPAIQPDGNANVKPFRDMAEQQAAMTDPRYQSDPDYRKMIAKRLGVMHGIDPRRYDEANVY